MTKPRAFLLLGLALAVGTLAAPPRACAHDYPTEITVEVERSVKFQVKDPGTCPAQVVAYIVNPNPLVSVTPDQGYGITVEFTVVAFSEPGEEIIVVEWVGKDALNGTEGPCQENSGPRPILVHVVAPPGDGSSGSTPNSGKSGDPVDTFTGELVFTEVPDLDMGGPLPLRFVRNYASKMRINFVVGNLGDNWRHEFEWSVHSAGTLASLVTPKGKVLKYLQEGSAWNLQSKTDSQVRLARDGNAWVSLDPSDGLLRRFDGNGRMTSIEDGRGNALLLEHDGDGHLERVVEDASPSTSRALLFDHDDGGRITSVTESWGGTPGRSISFSYEEDDLVSFTDAAGGITGYDYDDDHADPALLLARTSPRGNRPFTQTWDDVGKVETQSDAFGNDWEFDYGPPQKPGTTKMTRPDGKVETHQHDAAGFLVSAENGTGGKVVLADDGGFPRRASVVDASGARTLRAFDPASGLTTSRTDALGNVTTFTWADRASPVAGAPHHDLMRIDHPDGAAEVFTRDASGNATSRTDEEGNTWTWTWNGRGNLLTSTDPLGRTTTRTWNGWGDMASMTDEAGKVTTFTYDNRRRVSRVDRPDGTWTTFTRDALDRLTAETDGEGRDRNYTWDANGNRTAASDYEGITVEWTYDAMDRVLESEDGTGQVSSVSYDALGRIAAIEDRTGAASSRAYDAADRQVGQVDPLGRTWGSEYDGAGRVIASTFPSGLALGIGHDPEGRVESLTRPSGRMQWWARDARGRLVRSIDGAGRATRSELDGRGLPLTISTGGGAAVGHYSWDGAGRLTGAEDGNGGTWAFGRELRGLPSSRTDPLGRTTSMTFDAMGRPVRHDFPGGLGGLDLTRDGAGWVTRRAFTGGPTLDYDPDGEGRLQSATGATFARDGRGYISASNGMAVTRDGEGRLATASLGSGRTITYTRDAAGRLLSVSDGTGGLMNFQRDVDGRLTGLTRTNGVTTTFTLDEDGEIVGIREGTIAESLLLRDGNGDVVSAERTSPLLPDLGEGDEEDPVLDAAHQVVGNVHDALGRTMESGGREFAWDLASRLLAVAGGGADRTFTYDALGLPLTAEDGGGASTTFAWNHAYDLPVLARRTVDGVATHYVHAPDGTLLWSVDASGTRRWYHFDEAGNTLFLTNDAGTVTDAYAFDAWGRLTDSTGSTDNPFTFCGRTGAMREGFGDLYRMRLRIYDARARRFLTRDPLTERLEPSALAPYAYAKGDPLGNGDPTGEDPQPTGSSGMSSVDVASKLNAVAGGVADLVETGLKRVPNLALTRGQEIAKTGAGRLGHATAGIGTGIEIYNANRRMDVAGDAFSRRNREFREWFDRMMNECHLLYRQKRITHEQQAALRRALLDTLHAQLDASGDQFWTDTLQAGTIMTLNSFTGLIPGIGGLPALDWSNPNGIGGALGVVE